MDQFMLKHIVPVLGGLRHKGQNGKVGVIGGSFEYTGAPFYVAMSIIKGGGDIAHIFCSQQSSIPIKSYSPEPIVHPLLTNTDEQLYTEEQIESNTQKLIKWNQTLHSLVIGSGLGRNQVVGRQIHSVLDSITQPTVLDADALWFLENESFQQTVRSKSNLLVLTPNAAELKRLNSIFGWQQNPPKQNEVQDSEEKFQELPLDHPLAQNAVYLSKQLNHVTIFSKGYVDVITDGKQAFMVNFQGSLKRCGGQGDLLSGLTGLYCFWAYQQQQPLWQGCASASIILRRAAKNAYEKHKFSLSALDILGEIGPSFYETFFSKL